MKRIANSGSRHQENDAFSHRAVYLKELNDQLGQAQMQISGLQVELDIQAVELQRYRAEMESLGNDHLKYKELFQSAPIGYLMVDAFQQIKEINPAGAMLFGKRQHHVKHTPLPLYVTPDDRDRLRRSIDRVCAGAEERIQISLVGAAAKQTPVILYLHPVHTELQRGFNCQITMMDISEHRETEEQLRNARDYLEHVATHDPLTSLPNRRLFNDSLDNSLIAARRNGQKLAVLMLDLDQFKYINDTLGHEAGDALLRQTANRLKQAVSDCDIVARLGGDEFTVIINQVDHLTSVEHVCESIRESLARPYLINGQEVCTAASIGVSMYPTDSVHSKELIRFADAAMYRAKVSGRNCVRVFTADLSSELSRRFKLETDLRLGIREESFDVWYQPISCIKTGRIVGIEALTRWHHAERGLISPAEFISVAEECGAIEPLGYYVFDRACRKLVELHTKGFDELMLSVNVSPKQFALPGFVKQIRQILAATGMNPRFLELEVTESAVFHDGRSSRGVMEELKALGVQFAIDDFGTGYSSFARLRRLPISKIKIDQSFVQGLPHDTDDSAIARAILSMAEDLGLSVVSEGVESIAQLNALREMGCELFQGYLISEPMPEHLLLNVLRSNDLPTLRQPSTDAAPTLKAV